MNCYFVSRRLWLLDKSMVFTGGLEAHGRACPSPSPTPLSIFNGVKIMGRIVGNCEMAWGVINLPDELCHLVRGQRANLSSCFETQFMILTQCKTQLGQNRRAKDTEFSTHPFSWNALETHHSANKSVLRVYFVDSILLGAVQDFFIFSCFWKADTLVLPLRSIILCGWWSTSFFFLIKKILSEQRQ